MTSRRCPDGCPGGCPGGRRGGGPGRSSRSFSKDAVGLETELHRQFASKRVNQVNSRKEFFYATPAEVRDALQQFAGQHLIEFTEEPEALEWRAGRRVGEVGASAAGAGRVAARTA
ncbi:GIY-YIG nuclease family protein [Streptomyces humi]